MNSPLLQRIPPFVRSSLDYLSKAFDKTAAWVSQLSWWKFILLSLLILIAGSIVNDMWSPQTPTKVSVRHKEKVVNVMSKAIHEGNFDVRIDDNGISIRKINPPPAGTDTTSVPSTTPNTAGTAPATAPAAASAAASAASSSAPTTSSSTTSSSKESSVGESQLILPAIAGQAIGDAIDEAADEIADQKVDDYRRKSSAWFMNFVMLLIVGLFATKALMGGKLRAELRTLEANKSAEREALLRQVSEAKLHVMQAQIEPHFLFNTLASVEHLIETDPPRAAAMQRQLIQYLRAVLPQIRDNTMATHLGLEADMVSAYLTLQKMRMEERLHFELHIPEGLRSAAFPPMMLQSLVENAIQHGLEGKAEGGTLIVQAEVANGQLRVSVIDDGLGLGALPSDGTGLGLRSIRERLQLLHPGQSQLVMTPHLPSGVEARIEVPYHVAKL